MFETLQRGLSDALRTLRGKGKLSEANIREGLRLVQRALLEADVNYDVVRDFIARVTEKALGQDVLRAIDPSQQIVKFVYDELVALMGPVDHSLHYASAGPTILMLCGLQGSGKTTTCGKLALYVKSRGRKPMLVAADLQRPAAVEQLAVLGTQLGLPVYRETDSNPVRVCTNAVQAAADQDIDTLILDTAGRLHIDEQLMQELEEIDRKVQPHQIYLVADAMTGQDAVNSAKAFNAALELDGVILTKLDGDARGGAAMSVKAVTGVPIKFIGVGEKLDRLEEFHPDRMAGRIFGGGDILTLVEKVTQAQTDADRELAREQEEKLRKGQFTLEDFKLQLRQMKKLGSMRDVMNLIPGMSQMAGSGDLDGADVDLQRIEGIISSMTPDERRKPELIDMSRRRRIAAGSGTDPADVNRLLKDFGSMQAMMKQLASLTWRDRMKQLAGLGQAGAFSPGAKLLKKKERSHRKSARERAKEKKLRRREEKRHKRKK